MLNYFLQINLCWMLFYGVYYVLLSRETFFRVNRYWLIGSLLGSLVLPLGLWKMSFGDSGLTSVWLQPFVVSAQKLGHDTTLTATPWSLGQMLMLVYGLVALALAARLFYGVFRLWRLVQSSRREAHNGYTLVHTEGPHLPFSFFNWIFINEKWVEKADLPAIMLHEKAHVNQKHSYDVMAAELLSIVFWLSPFVWTYRRSLKIVHEYLADEAVLAPTQMPIYQKEAVKNYGYLLIKQSQSGMPIVLVNHFFSQLKKRIHMMTRTRSSRIALLKYTLAAPITAVLLTFFAMIDTQALAQEIKVKLTTAEEINKIDPNDIASVNIDKSPSGNSILVALKNGEKLRLEGAELEKFTAQKPNNTGKERIFVQPLAKGNPDELEKQPTFKGGQEALFRYLGSAMRYPTVAREAGVEGTVFVMFVVKSDGSISNVEVRRGVTYPDQEVTFIEDPNTGTKGTKKVPNKATGTLEKEAVRVIESMPNWEPGVKNGKPVDVVFTLPIRFKLS